LKKQYTDADFLLEASIAAPEIHSPAVERLTQCHAVGLPMSHTARLVPAKIVVNVPASIIDAP
jgi:hypothetical protein